MMTKLQLDEYRKKYPDAATRADAERARVAALLVAFAPYEGKELDDATAVRLDIAELDRELCIDGDGASWNLTDRGRALLDWHANYVSSR